MGANVLLISYPFSLRKKKILDAVWLVAERSKGLLVN